MQAELGSLKTSDVKLRITNTLSIALSGRDWVFLKNSEAVGFLKLDKEVKLFGTTYSVIKIIYLVPAIRKTRAAGAFLTGVKKVISHPLILGSDNFGGVLYQEGAKLVQALNNPARSHISVLNLRTGEKQDLGDQIPFRPSHLTLIFEECNVPLLISEAKNIDGLKFVFNGVTTQFLFEGAEERPFTTDGKL